MDKFNVILFYKEDLDHSTELYTDVRSVVRSDDGYLEIFLCNGDQVHIYIDLIYRYEMRKVV